MLNNKKAFTIIELVVVISILATLSTIWFISYSWYLVWVRDTNRASQLTSISEWLNIYLTKGKLPYPEDKVDIKSGSDIIAYQWLAWAKTLLAINYSKEWLDPKENIPYSYYLTANRKYFQLMWFLEDETNLASWIVNSTYAIDYSMKYPILMWNKLWILTTDNNQPITDLWLSPSELDISNVVNLPLKSYLTSTEYVEWTWTTFAELKNVAKRWGKYYSIVWNTFNYDPPVY
jgi:prepilin-type N-terminal cleavage/methylation domain-containing protein